MKNNAILFTTALAVMLSLKSNIQAAEVPIQPSVSELEASAVGMGEQRSLAQYWAEKQFIPVDIQADSAAISMISISEDKSLLVTAGSAVKVWDLKSKKIMHTFEHITKATFSTGSKLLVFNPGDGFIRIWNASMNTYVGRIAESSISQLEIARHGKYLAVGKTDNTVTIYELQTFDKIINKSFPRLGYLNFLSEDRDLAIFQRGEHRGKWICSTWNVIDNRQHSKFQFSSNFYNHFKFYRGGNIVKSTITPTQIITVDAKTGKKISSIITPDKAGPVTFSNDGLLIAVGFPDGSIQIWNIRTGEFIKKLAKHDSAVTELDFSEDGVLLVSGSKNGVIKIWQAAK